MINVGIIGIGFMGVTHYQALKKVRGARVCALATRDQRKLSGDWRQVQGNFGGAGGVEDLSKVACYDVIEDLLADPKVDLVDVCLPTPMHPECGLQALNAGKHVFVEKPIALKLADADRLVAEGARRKRRFMVGHVLRFFPEFRLIKQLADSGDYGDIRVARLKRVISRPSWWDPDDLLRTGGPAIDLHIHDADFVQYLFGMPQAVSASGFVGADDVVEHVDTHYHFRGRSMSVSAMGGWLAQAGCPFEHGYDVFFEDATLKYNSSWGQPPTLLTSDGKTRRPRLSTRDAFVGELQEVVDAVRDGRDSPILGGRSARNSLLLCLREIQSVKGGRKVRI